VFVFQNRLLRYNIFPTCASFEIKKATHTAVSRLGRKEVLRFIT
jgi:hypothetical protein